MNFPNPFSSEVTIELEAEAGRNIRIAIMNSLGQVVDEFSSVAVHRGKNQVRWDAGGLPDGIYFCLVNTGAQVASGKMMKVH
jgi:hypothetical protein